MVCVTTQVTQDSGPFQINSDISEKAIEVSNVFHPRRQFLKSWDGTRDIINADKLSEPAPQEICLILSGTSQTMMRQDSYVQMWSFVFRDQIFALFGAKVKKKKSSNLICSGCLALISTSMLRQFEPTAGLQIT